VLIDHKGEGIEVDGGAVVLRWPDKWSTDAARRALSPRRIPLTAISRLEFVERAVAIRVHLHGEDPAQTFSPATSINAVSVPLRHVEDAKSFVQQANELLSDFPDIIDQVLTRSAVQQVQDARQAGRGGQAIRPQATDVDDRRRNWLATPAGQARTALERGHGWHEYVGTVESTYRGGDGRSHTDVISEIEREGWELVFVDHVWRGVGPASPQAALSSGERPDPTGEIVGIYMFKSMDKPVRTDEPWNR
jgi:Domain of unknown function (DUF4429)